MLRRENDLPVSVLRDLLDLDCETGKLTWKLRDIKYFSEGKGKKKKRTAEHAAKQWNFRYAGKPALTAKQGSGHLHGRIFDKRFFAHRVVFALHNGYWPKQYIDHINGDCTDNRPCNLRDVSHRENQRNRKVNSNNTSGVMGVSYCKRLKKWQVSVGVNFKSVHVGFFENKQDAITARKRTEKSLGFHTNHGRTQA